MIGPEYTRAPLDIAVELPQFSDVSLPLRGNPTP